ncbi:DUF2726 domain-containing protein [Novosphingobium malaysiense]|uniref:DUF2726 domain-containing protein n=1 Tax=Novosphingobium malaysiense TaxID=1348853 RepID=UPI0009DE33A9|nr:DUF2726 domain-containing protein [Novosphingobium malaysiense]
MPPEIIALIDKPHLLVMVLAVGAFCGIAVERSVNWWERRQRKTKWKNRRPQRFATRSWREKAVTPSKRTPDRALNDAAEQLRCVMEAKFLSRPLLNHSERRLLGVIDAALADHSPGWRAMGQVSLGEILSSPDEQAFFAINSKRVDLLIVDANCKPLHAIEFQGKGHHASNNTAARDAVKKEALRRAGVGYVEVVSGDTPAEVRDMIRKLASRIKTA